MATTAADIQELYIAYFGRPADPAGLLYWIGVADQQGLLKTANFFGTTPEFQQRIGSLSTEQAINTFYVNLFGRQADPAGLLFWTQKVQTGVFSLEDAGFYIANNTAPADATVLSNKVQSAELWTKNLDTTDEILAFNTQSGQAAGITFLTGVVNTPATEAQTTAAIQQMVKDSGGSEGGITFNQIAPGAILTSNVNTNNNQGPGFTPGNKLLTNASDTVVLNALDNAFIQDTFGSDNDIAKLIGGATNVNSLVGIETIKFEGAAAFAAPVAQGIKSIEFNNFAGQAFNSFDQAQTALVTLQSKSQVVTLGNNGNAVSAVAITVGDANQGTLNFAGGGNGSAITFKVTGSAVTQFTFNAGLSRLRTLNVYAGSGQTNAFEFRLFAINNSFTAGSVLSAGGDFTLALNNANAFLNTQGNVLSFNDGGVSTIALNAAGATVSANLTVVSGLNQLYIRNTQGGAIGLTANVNVDKGVFTLSFQSAFLSQAFTGAVGANGIVLSAQGVSGGSDVLNLNFASFSNFSLSNQAVVASGFETLNLNIFNTTGTFAISGGFNAQQANTFNLAANAGGSILLGSAGTTGLRTFGLSQADGGVTFTVSTQIASAVKLDTVFGAGVDVINLRNIANGTANLSAGALLATTGALADLIDGLNTIDISDGGADVVLLGFTAAQSRTASEQGLYQRASIAGFGVGDVLSFTQQVTTAAGVAVLAGLTDAQVSAGLGTGNIGLFFDGTDTLVFFSGSGVSAADDAPASLAGVLRGTNLATAARWNLNNQGALQLIA
ncbi:DUF4214 domain-containing protein [Cyanobium sp. FGCU-52]|nr:DUF4214 domain-containing protein [Cyanobium sp. FGCU52]